MMGSITGELGAGKTYDLALREYRAYMQGCFCLSNFDHVYSHVIVKNDPDTLIELIRQIAQFKERGYEICDLLPTFKHGGIFLAIDESHLAFGRDISSSSETMQEIILPFISLARKADVHIWYTAQDPATIHKTFRRYTRDWIRIRPIIPIFRNVFTPHPTRPTMRREKRLLLQWVWEETHHLNYENPVFNYSKRKVDGISEHTEAATLQSRRIRRNNNAFIHSLYNSHEMSGVNIDYEKQEEFDLLKGLAYIEPTLRKEKFNRIRKAFGIAHDQIPTRYQFRHIDLPPLESVIDAKMKAQKQPVELLDDISFFLNKKHRTGIDRTLRKKIESESRSKKPEEPKITVDALAEMNKHIKKPLSLPPPPYDSNAITTASGFTSRRLPTRKRKSTRKAKNEQKELLATGSKGILPLRGASS